MTQQIKIKFLRLVAENDDNEPGADRTEMLDAAICPECRAITLIDDLVAHRATHAASKELLK